MHVEKYCLQKNCSVVVNEYNINCACGGCGEIFCAPELNMQMPQCAATIARKNCEKCLEMTAILRAAAVHKSVQKQMKAL